MCDPQVNLWGLFDSPDPTVPRPWLYRRTFDVGKLTTTLGLIEPPSPDNYDALCITTRRQSGALQRIGADNVDDSSC